MKLTLDIVRRYPAPWFWMVVAACKVWNRAVAVFCVWAAKYLAAVCYLVLFLGVGRDATELELDRAAEGSMWREVKRAGEGTYRFESFARQAGGEAPSWVRSLAAPPTGWPKWWVWCLLPFLLLLAQLETERGEHSSPTDIYTLF